MAMAPSDDCEKRKVSYALFSVPTPSACVCLRQTPFVRIPHIGYRQMVYILYYFMF